MNDPENTISTQYLKSLLFLILMAFPLLISCKKVQAARPVQPAVNLTGRWTLTTDRGPEGEMELRQNGDDFTGEVDAGYVKGTVSGNRVTIELEGGTTWGTGVIEGDSISGEYETEEDPYFGTWSADRVTEDE